MQSDAIFVKCLEKKKQDKKQKKYVYVYLLTLL